MQKLLKQLTPQLKAIAKKLTPDQCLQEDLFQEMSLHLCQQWQDDPNQTASWYTQSCRYHALDYLKAGRSVDSKLREGVEILPIWHQQPDGMLEPLPVLSETDFESEIIGSGLVAALKQALTEKQGKILDFLLQGYTEKEIGAAEGVSRQSIHQQRVRIRQIAMEVLSDASLQRVG